MADVPEQDRHLHRLRMVTRQWLRDPSGGLLPRPPPVGTRAPNGLIWGHSLEDFMWIQRIPNVNVLTIWSRSMIKEFSENYDESEFDKPEPPPRTRRPWPVLRIAHDARNKTIPPVGAYDEGSDHEDDAPGSVRQWRVRADDPKTGESCEDKIIARFVVEDMSDVLMPNDSEHPVISPLGHPYAALWTPDFRQGYAAATKNGTFNRYSIIRKPGSRSGHGELADDTGLMAVIMHDTDGHTAVNTKRDPIALIMEDGGKTLTIFHDPTPVVFIGKTLKRERRNAGMAEKGSAKAPDEDATESKEATVTDDVEMSNAVADEDDKAEHAETKMATAETSRDDQLGASAAAEAGTVTDVASTPMADITPTPVANFLPAGMTDKGTRLVMIGFPGDDSDSEDEREAESEENDVGETEPEALTKYINADGIFDQDVLAELPKLEESIPEEYFPDALMVHRQGQVRRSCPSMLSAHIQPGT